MIVPNPEQRSWEEASGNVRDKMTRDQRFVVARKQEGRGVSGARRSRPRRNATPARINRSRDPGEFIRFVAASLKAARVSFASRSLRGAGGQRRRPRDESRRRLDNGQSHLDKKRGRDHWKCSNPGRGPH
ncbi:uncharacterized protein LOC126866827 [Bombus huntii]|uniref:uncharacterized protein LOC126866827 n=1 Tax=Bombus huntii TaxID=85661 RepID=UPI0021AA3787|nr:uncharacterized protein LOC126866827 [Bombus huntii]